MNAITSFVALFALGTLLKGSIVAGAVLALARLLGAGRARARYAIVLSALVGGIILSALSSALPEGAAFAPSRIVLPSRAFGLASRPEAATGTPPAIGMTPAAAETSPKAFSKSLPMDIIAILWMSGVAAILAYWLAGRLALRRIEIRATPIGPGTLLSAASSAMLRLGIRGRVAFKYVDADVPFTAGYLRPVVYLPRAAEEWDAQKIEAAFLHELAHVKRKDILSMALGRLSVLLCWASPLAWMAYASLKRDREEAADRLVLDSGFRPSAYASILLGFYRASAASRIQARACGMAQGLPGGGRAGERIRRILSAAGAVDRPYRARRGIAWAGTISALVLAGSLHMAFAQESGKALAAAPGTLTDDRPLLHPLGAAALGKARISLSYGPAKNPLTGKDFFHEGLDFPVPVGEPVYATGKGRIGMTGFDPGYGRYLFVNHGNFLSFYAHLDSVSMRTGDEVKAGQRIGTSGSTGMSTGPHLHYEIKLARGDGSEGSSLDPRPFLEAR